MRLEIQEARPEDSGKIKEIETDSSLSPWKEEDYRAEAARDDSLFFIAFDLEAERIAGFIIMRLITHESSSSEDSQISFEAEVLNLAIRSEYRRKGIGRMLLRRVLGELSQRGKGSVFLEVREQNEIAISFYRSAGFQVVGRRRRFYRNPDDDALLMNLAI